MSEPKPKKKLAPAKPSTPPTAAAAYDKIERKIAAVDPTDLVPINLDIPQAVSVALGVIPGLAEHRPAIQRDLPNHPLDELDDLEDYALAAWYTHLLSLPSSSPGSAVKLLLEEAAPLRATLLSDADALARRGYLSKSAVDAIREGQGNVDLANDLVALSALFFASWSEVEHKTAASFTEVKRAGELGPQLLSALGVRKHGTMPTRPEALDRRARAFTLFVRAYDQTRRAIAYLRWDEGDADEIMPSLYQGRGRSRREAPAEAPAAGDADGAALPAGEGGAGAGGGEQPGAPEGRPVGSRGQPGAPEGRPVGSRGQPGAPEGRPVGSRGQPAAPERPPAVGERLLAASGWPRGGRRGAAGCSIATAIGRRRAAGCPRGAR